MSFAVSVVQPHVPQPIDFASASHEEVDMWVDEERRFNVFEAAIAADGLFYSCYAVIASELGLPLLTRTYEHGLTLSAEDDLRQFLQEVECIQAAWHQRDLRAQWQNELHGPVRWERLQEGAADLKQATHIALEQRLELHLG